MSIQHFSSGTQFFWQGTSYDVLMLLPDQKINIEDILTGARLVVEMSVLVTALFKGELVFVEYSKPDQKEVSENIGGRGEYIALSECSEEWVAIAKYRLEVILPLLSLEKRTRIAVEERVKQLKMNGLERKFGSSCFVSVSSIYRWIRYYTKSGGDVRSLIFSPDKRGGKGKSRLQKKADAMIDSVIQDKYYVREKITIKAIREELAVRVHEENQLWPQNQQLAMPSESTITRRIRAVEPYKKLEAKRGARTAKQVLSQYGKTEYPTLPLERVEIDHTKSDLIVIDDRDNLPLGRLTLTYCLDMATRYPLGYYLGFEPPSYLSVMECLYHAIRPKENLREKYGTEHDWLAYGVPSVLVVDNGKEFIGHDLEDTCLPLGIVVEQMPVKTPYFKAGIERMYRSLNTMLFHTLPGTTFSNIAERGDYNSAKQACIYLSDVDKVLNIFVVDVYAQQFHRGLNGIPAHSWEKAIRSGFGPGLPHNTEELSILLGRTTTRVIQHYGIDFCSLRYNCDDLITLRTRLKREKAKIKYHPADLSYLYVYDSFEKEYIKVPALAQDYTQGLSLWKHQVIRQSVLAEQNHVDIVALGKARRKIQEIVDQGRQSKRTASRSRMARWDTSGKPIHQFIEESQPCVNSTSNRFLAGDVIQSPPKFTLPRTGIIPDLEPSTDWEICYPMPKRNSDILKDNTKKEE